MIFYVKHQDTSRRFSFTTEMANGNLLGFFCLIRFFSFFSLTKSAKTRFYLGGLSKVSCVLTSDLLAEINKAETRSSFLSFLPALKKGETFFIELCNLSLLAG